MAEDKKSNIGNLFKRVLLVLTLTLAIPVIGYLVSYFVTLDINKNLASSEITIQALCGNLHLLTDLSASDQQDLRGACEEYHGIALLQQASIYAGLTPGNVWRCAWAITCDDFRMAKA